MTTFSISLPTPTAKQLDKEVKQAGFASRSEFIRALLRKYFTNELELKSFKPQRIEDIKVELAKTGKYSEKFIESVTKGISKSTLYDR